MKTYIIEGIEGWHYKTLPPDNLKPGDSFDMILEGTDIKIKEIIDGGKIPIIPKVDNN